MHIIVAGCGRVGSGLALGLLEQGHSVAIVDRNAKAFRRLGEDFAGQMVVGQAFDRDTLTEAGAQKANAFAAVTSGDNSNILAARIAKETFQIPAVVARIYDPKRAAIYQRLGIATVATVAWTTEQVQRRLFTDVASDWTDQSGSMSLIERSLPASWAGRRLTDLKTDDYKVVAVSRAGVAKFADADTIGQDGDVVHLMVRTTAIAALEAVLAGPAHGGH